MAFASRSSDPRTVLSACDHIGEGVVVVDDSRVILYMNEAAHRLMGTPQRALQQPSRCMTVLRCGTLGEPNRFCGRCQVSQALQPGGQPTRFGVAIGQLGRRVRVQASCLPVPGQPPFALLVLRPDAAGDGAGEEPALCQPGAVITPQGTAVLQELVRAAVDLLAADYAALGRLDEFRLEVQWLVQQGSLSPATAGTRVPLGSGIRGRVISTAQPVCIANFPAAAPDPPDQHPTMQSEGLRAALAVPVFIRGISAGVLMVANRHQTEYGPAQTQVLRNLAGLAGEVLNHSDWVVSTQAASIRAEREWLAAELHDGLAQLMGAMNQRLKLARWVLGQSADPTEVAADLQQVLELSEQAHQELRLALGELRTQGAESDLPAALRAALQSFSSRSGMAVALVEEPERFPPLSGPVALQVLRIVQEALSNARKHSGGTQVRVRWTYGEGVHRFAISDDGRGLTEPDVGRGFGISIMTDRARCIGGQLQIDSAPSSGCTVLLTVPDQRAGGSVGDADPRSAG